MFSILSFRQSTSPDVVFFLFFFVSVLIACSKSSTAFNATVLAEKPWITMGHNACALKLIFPACSLLLWPKCELVFARADLPVLVALGWTGEDQWLRTSGADGGNMNGLNSQISNMILQVKLGI
jgi:hypothetical protein